MQMPRTPERALQISGGHFYNNLDKTPLEGQNVNAFISHSELQPFM